MATDVTNMLGGFNGMLNTLSGWAIPIVMIVLVGVVLYVLYASGLLFPRPLKCIIRIPRASGGFKTVFPKARRIKGGLLEVAYGLFSIDKLNAPSDAQIAEGNICEGLSTSKNEVTWFNSIRVLTEGADGKILEYKTAISESAELAYATAYAQAYERTHKPNLLTQLAPYGAFLLASVIIFLAIYMAGKSWEESAKIIVGPVSDLNARIVNSSVTVYSPNKVQPTTPAPTTTNVYYTPPPG